MNVCKNDTSILKSITNLQMRKLDHEYSAKNKYKVWSKKFETHNLLYCRKTIKFTKMNFKSADTLGIKLSEMIEYISVPIIVFEISKKMFQTHFFKISHSCF